MDLSTAKEFFMRDFRTKERGIGVGVIPDNTLEIRVKDASLAEDMPELYEGYHVNVVVVEYRPQ